MNPEQQAAYVIAQAACLMAKSYALAVSAVDAARAAIAKATQP